MKKNLGIHIFRRDLRIEDNISLNYASQMCNKILPIFIFDPKQIENNKYKSDNAIQFMVNSLKSLNNAISENGELYIFYGDTLEVLKYLVDKINISLISYNMDYTPFAKARDSSIKKEFESMGIEILSKEDSLINNVNKVLNKGIGYKVFTPYYNKAKNCEIKSVSNFKVTNFYKLKSNYSSKMRYIINFSKAKSFFKENPNIAVKGGREEAIFILKNNFNKYSENKNIPSIETTKLSSHLKFGTISVREVLHVLNKQNASEELIRQIYWRDFWVNITYFNPNVLNKNFYSKFDKIEWSNNKKYFDAWKDGKTGVPIVDAGIRELNETGFMHNRVRMLVASFLIKNLHIDWRLGAKYFANNLVDYCPMQNQNNWQSISGTGASSLVWFRVMNPFLQQKKYDPDCKYIKKWIPELKFFTSKEIHDWNNNKYINNNYPFTIVNMKDSGREFVELIKNVLNS